MKPRKLNFIIKAYKRNPAKTGLTGFFVLIESILIGSAIYIRSFDSIYVMLLFTAILYIFYVGGIETFESLE